MRSWFGPRGLVEKRLTARDESSLEEEEEKEEDMGRGKE